MNSVEPLIVKLISQALKLREWKLATAESCTGGGVAFYLTHLAGSSNWFERGFVTYSNLAKEELLSVQAATIKTCGTDFMGQLRYVMIYLMQILYLIVFT